MPGNPIPLTRKKPGRDPWLKSKNFPLILPVNTSPGADARPNPAPFAELLQRSDKHHRQIDRLITRYPSCPRPASSRVDWHLGRSEALCAAHEQFLRDWGWQ